MPDLKDKYSDQELDRSHTAFDEIVNRPDMKALDDQGNAIARDLKASEDRPAGNETHDPGEPKSSNPFNYERQATQKSSAASGSGWSRKQKAGAFGGLTAVLGGSIAVLFMLLPLKIPGIMQMIADEAGQRVEQVTERRAKIILGRAIVSKFASGSGLVITGNGPVSTLVTSMRTSKFEKKLAAKGLTIQPSGNGVILKMHGERLGKGVLRNEIEVVRALESQPLSNKMLKEVIKEEIPSWRWMKRAKFAKWLRIKYGIPRYGIENNKDPDEEKRIAAMQEERLATEYEALASDMGEVAECLPSLDCETDPYSPGDGESDGTGPVREQAEESGESVAKENSQANAVPKTLIADISTKLATKAIPVVGWIDLLATVDHLAYETSENDYFGKLAAYYRAKQYARHYGVWSGYGSQIQLGAMDTSYISVLAAQTEGIEESQAFNLVDGNIDKDGKIPGTEPDKINANNPSEVSKKFKEIVPLVNGYDTLAGKSAHAVLGFYYRYANKLFESIGGFIAGLTPDELFEWARPLVSKTMTKVFQLLGLDFDPAVKGASWFNAAHGGATWTYNDFCKVEMGCRKLSAAEAALQNATIATERAEYDRQRGLGYVLFSTDSTQSLSTKLAVQMPTDVATALPTLTKLIASAPSTILNVFTPKASAGGYIDIHGVDPYGATDKELNQPVDPKAISGDPCSEAYTGETLDLCRADKLVAEAMLCEFEPESADCVDTDAVAMAEIEFTVGSYNQKKSLSEAEHQKAVENIVSLRMDIVGTQETGLPKYDRYMRNLATQNYGVYPEHMKGSRTCSGNQAIFYNKAKFTLEKGEWFEIPRYPDPAAECGGGESTNANHNTEGGKLPAVWTHIPIVWLKENQTGRVVIAINTHNVANVSGAAGTLPAYSRLVANKIYIEQIQRLRAENPETPIVFTGDFNEGTGVRTSGNVTYQGDVNNLLFCMFAKNGLMFSTGGPEMKCGGHGIGGVDYIYATPEVEVESFHELSRSEAASDHPAIYARLRVPGTKNSGSMRIATFNILHVGDSAFEKQWRTRMQTSIDVLKKNHIDVAGLQEVRPDQHNLLTSERYITDTYDVFPKTAKRPGFTPNPIIWDKSKFTLVTGKTLAIEYDNGNKIDHAVIVKLKDAASNEFYVMNTHDPANVRPGSEAVNQQSRIDNARFYAQYFSELKKEGAPMFLTGDFNNGYTDRSVGDNLTYCIISSSGVLKNVWDIVENKQFKCPRDKTPGDAPIDHIYAGAINGVSKVWTAPRITNGSDHPTVMAEIVMPWSVDEKNGSSAVVGGWSWPVDQKWWKTARSDFLSAHPTYSGTFTSPYQTGVAVDIGNPPDGSPVYAMLGGTVIKTNLCGAGDGMIIESDTPQGKVQIAYGHGTNPRFKVNDTVKSGQQILNLGASGCQVSGGHLHVDMAIRGKHICPQDVFLAMGEGKSPDLIALAGKARSPCGR